MDLSHIDNDINVIIKSKQDGILFDENCCTVLNIVLTNEGKIGTSFLGVHNEYIIKVLEKAQKAYFKALKKTLKQERANAKNIIDEEIKDNKSNETELSETFKKANEESIRVSNNENTKCVETTTEQCEHVCSKDGKPLAKKKITTKKTAK